MDEPTFTGCPIPSRLIGVIEAKQTEKGKTERNDRLIAVAAKSKVYADIKSLSNLNRGCWSRWNIFLFRTMRSKGKDSTAWTLWSGKSDENSTRRNQIKFIRRIRNATG
jgi:inorganic pyrophosphatase